jgi:hypothetical protein
LTGETTTPQEMKNISPMINAKLINRVFAQLQINSMRDVSIEGRKRENELAVDAVDHP